MPSPSRPPLPLELGARIVRSPIKRKGHVVVDVAAPRERAGGLGGGFSGAIGGGIGGVGGGDGSDAERLLSMNKALDRERVELMAKLKEAFDEADHDGDGYLRRRSELGFSVATSCSHK